MPSLGSPLVANFTQIWILIDRIISALGQFCLGSIKEPNLIQMCWSVAYEEKAGVFKDQFNTTGQLN